MAVLLGKLQGFQDHPTTEVVVADLAKTNQGKLLPQRVPLETVIRKDSAQIRVTAEGKAIEVPDLPFQPVGTGKNSRDRGNRMVRSSSKGKA
jgi:hypothetical protein